MNDEAEVSALEAAHSEDMAGHGEPWDAWETQLVLYSIVIGIGGLIVLGVLINVTILS